MKRQHLTQCFLVVLASFMSVSTSCKKKNDETLPNPPSITFLTEGGFNVYLGDTALPYIQAKVTTEDALTNVRISSLLSSSTWEEIQDINTFENPKELDINILPPYKVGMTNLRIRATDSKKQIVFQDLPFTVTADSTKVPDTIPPPPPAVQRLAFPTADGFGKYTWGGRGGKVLTVTTLEDNGNNSNPTAGSLRWAVRQRGARTVVFAVAGHIKLKSRLSISNDSITIAGHTAPGDGICIRDNEVIVEANEVIIRYMRFRMGDETNVNGDAFQGRNRRNIILDHCSVSWATDETSSWYDNSNFTMQWCLLAESLRHSVHNKGDHGYTGIWGGKKATFHHNLIAHSDSRNPRFCGSRYSNRPNEEHVDFRNNVIYNWGSNSGYAGEGGSYNMVNNYYQPGPQSGNPTRIFQPNADDGTNSQPAGVWGKFYVAGNMMKAANGNTNGNVTNDNWNGIHPNPSSKPKSELKSETEFDNGGIATETAEAAYESVLAKVGASFKRDAIDTRIVDEVRNRKAPARASGGAGTKNGLIDSQSDVGGWCTLDPGTAPACTANDGIPDTWKTAKGLPISQNVASRYDLSEIYTNLEIYLSELLNE